MSYYKIKYTIIPKTAYTITRSCPKCGGKTCFESTNKFRVNANASKLDVWLIYQCKNCKSTYNLSVYERIGVKNISNDEYDRFINNDQALALKIGTSKEIFTRNKADINLSDIDFEVVYYEKDFVFNSGSYELIIENPYNLKIKTEKALSRILKTSRSKIKQLQNKGDCKFDYKHLQNETNIYIKLNSAFDNNSTNSKRVCVIMGSPHKDGNTATLCKPFIEEFEKQGVETDYVYLYDLNINPCKGCYACQNVSGEYGCIINDDVHKIMAKIIAADCIVLATPIFAWYCTAPMKAFLDRHYGMNKYYGSAEGSLWQGKKVALITTNGYEKDYATEPFELGIKRLCKHSKLEYIGLYSVRDKEDLASFTSIEAVTGTYGFARLILNKLNGK